MSHPRFLTAVLSLSLSATTLVGGTLLTGERQAIAAARRTVKTASGRATRARRTNDPTSSARRTSDLARDSADAAALAKGAASRERDTPAEKTVVARIVEKPGVKNQPESSPSTKSTAEGAKPAPEVAPGRSTEAHPAVAKAPTENPSNVKLTPEKSANELSAGDAVDAPRSAVDSSAPSARREIASGSTPAARPVLVTLDGLVFDGGDVPRAAAALDRMKSAFVRCASIENALTKNEATIDVRFLVRAPGRAEGVGVDKARGVSGDVVKCMTSVLARSYIGAPSDDPVGVAVTLRMRKD